MKNRYKEIRNYLLLILCGFLLCYVIYFLVDAVFNGMFADWFKKNYYMESYDTSELGDEIRVTGYNWLGIKNLIVSFMGLNVILWITSIYAYSRYYAKVKVKRMITQVSNEIHDYMLEEKITAESLPKEHAEIVTQLVSLKATMQRHEQLLKEEAARKNDLITYLAHDLKTPLTSVIGYLSLLEEIPEMPLEQRARYVNITLDKAKRLEKLINEFFDITRYNLQQIVLEKETLDLHYMLLQMVDEFYPILQPHGNTIDLCIDEITIYGDAQKLARVFNNILKNAVAYSYPGTAIRIWAERSVRDVQIFFQNRGRTIPEHKLESIFDKFFRLDEARATNTGGAGLGLAIAKEIIQLHGGSITAGSENEMTTFCVKFPLNV
ncbi:HAMP domain-containing sensor histidine kinase [Roseburia hominis]